jgi:acyl-CoA synthetase (AMP-forming)/AMP-acid ligase II
MQNYETQRLNNASRSIAATIMERPLRVTDLLGRAERIFAQRAVLSRVRPGHPEPTTYAQLGEQARRLAAGLRARGVRPGMRVAPLMWNHAMHVAAYYAVPAIEAVLHPLNPRLTAEQLAYVVADAGDAAVIVDENLLPLWSEVERLVKLSIVIVNGAAPSRTAISELLAIEPLAEWPSGPFDENTAVSICHTSGTTGQPKGVVYSHRSTLLHALAASLPDALALSGNDVLLARHADVAEKRICRS